LGKFMTDGVVVEVVVSPSVPSTVTAEPPDSPALPPFEQDSPNAASERTAREAMPRRHGGTVTGLDLIPAPYRK
jgi:hypothetical protein